MPPAEWELFRSRANLPSGPLQKENKQQKHLDKRYENPKTWKNWPCAILWTASGIATVLRHPGVVPTAHDHFPLENHPLPRWSCGTLEWPLYINKFNKRNLLPSYTLNMASHRRSAICAIFPLSQQSAKAVACEWGHQSQNCHCAIIRQSIILESWNISIVLATSDSSFQKPS